MLLPRYELHPIGGSPCSRMANPRLRRLPHTANTIRFCDEPKDSTTLTGLSTESGDHPASLVRPNSVLPEYARKSPSLLGPMKRQNVFLLYSANMTAAILKASSSSKKKNGSSIQLCISPSILLNDVKRAIHWGLPSMRFPGTISAASRS